jgi:hypothetical protein
VNCLAGTQHNAGEVNVTYASPDFGSGSGLMEYETPAIGGDGGNCSVTTDRLCVIDTDCPSGESCARTDGAFALRYRIETIEPCGNAAVVERFSGCRQASSEAACVGLGGSWGRGGLSTVPFCTCATGQDGCPCSAPEDCRGFCVAEGVIPAECGGAVRGTCAGYSPLFGCFCTFGESGTAAELCVD